ncbi:MAG TPA: DUF2092 domain-containing protein [Verrucomicrobiae bacterium]|nr:DUF2092 domain-containing protein [Verrucomicrobiae bacterium]
MKFLAWAGAVSLLAVTTDAQTVPRVDPQAERVLRAACQYLAEAPYFSINAEIWREHVNEEGEKVQFSRSMEMEIRRPNRLHAEIASPHSDRVFWYDGKSLTVLDRKQNVFSSVNMPATLDETIDTARDQFGIDFPMIDLAVSDPWTNAMAKVITGRYFGLAPAMGFNCHHLAFTQENIDWQIWVQDGPQPLIRKFIITHKNEPGVPEFTGLIREWDFNSRISANTFAFQAPPGAMKIQMHGDAAQPGEGVPRPTGATEPRSTR